MNGKTWVLGGAVIDFLPDDEGRLLQCPGGAPASVTVGVTRLNGGSGFTGCVGDDPLDRSMCHTLVQEQVDVNYIHLDAAQRTSTIVVNLDQHGGRALTSMVRLSADLFLQPEDFLSFAAGQQLYICSIALGAGPSRSTTSAAVEVVKRAGDYVSFDPNIRSNLWQDPQDLRGCLDRTLAPVDAIKLPEEELTFVSGSDGTASGTARLNARFQSTLLLVARGKAGVQAVLRGRASHFPARPVVAINTTGTGDAFITGLFAGLVAHGVSDNLAALAPDLTLAQACDTLATTVKGVMTALLYRDGLQHSL